MKVVIFGTGKLAELVYYYLTHDSNYEVVAFAIDEEYLDQKELFGLPIVAFENIVDLYPPTEYKMFIAISHAKLNEVRTKKYNEAKNKGYSFASYFSSKTICWENIKIGENCLVMENCCVQPFSSIGDNTIVFAGTFIGHHTKIGKNCYLAPSCVIAGGIEIADNCFIGMNATVSEGVSVAERSIIGANSLIMKNTDFKSVYIANKTEKCPKDSDIIKDRLQPSRNW